ncbi:MAG: molybdate ABC transporter substrate-binding protein [OM182 bacterium MED-G24]|uniref:Molybdate ABC transporter substrate-binding protein n=1 Tax=OM182 bacterium MED-G24 TaxID=1986255 RepID=A0A2A5WZG1_9GAMM|nr:MAG: molybdate ABC transporter substrate-binding protein [OM182 bacterium MED-G24]
MKMLSMSLLTVFLSSSACAEVVRVAVASNFRGPMVEIAKRFESESPHELVISYGASGKLFAQIVNGAPFDVFLSADKIKPQRLIDLNLAESNSRITYAFGRLVLWSPLSSDRSFRDMLRETDGRIAMANPRLAPYGQAARETLATLSLTEQTRGRWVLGENIAQTFHFVHSGNAQMGFVAKSQLKDAEGLRGTTWAVEPNLHSPIAQDAVVLGPAAESVAARSFIQLLHSEPILELIRRHGYATTIPEPGMGSDQSQTHLEALDIE